MLEFLCIFIPVFSIMWSAYTLYNLYMNRRSVSESENQEAPDFSIMFDNLSRRDKRFIVEYTAETSEELHYQIKSMRISLITVADMDRDEAEKFLSNKDLNDIHKISIAYYYCIMNQLIHNALDRNVSVRKEFKHVVPIENLAAVCIQLALMMFLRHRYEPDFEYDSLIQDVLSTGNQLNELIKRVTRGDTQHAEQRS